MVNTELAVKIFSAVFQKDNPNAGRRRQELVTKFTHNIFQDEFYVFYSILKKYPNLNKISDDFLILYMSMKEGAFKRVRAIDLNKFSIGGGEGSDPYQEFAASCLGVFRQCCEGNVSDDDFYLALEQYRLEYVNEQSVILMQDGATIVSEGMKSGRQYLSGFEDMQKHIKTGLSNLDGIVNTSQQRGIITYGVNDTEESEEPLKVLCNYGVEPLDEALGGITEGDMISILGAAKGGKSRFMTYIIHNAVMHGINVAVWSIENGMKGWECLVRARHFDYLYNNKDTDGSTRRFINDDLIRKGKLTGELATREAASWLELKSNTAYGKLTSIDAPFELDTFLETIDQAVKQGGAQLIAVDYLQLIGGGTSGIGKSKQERIADAYQKTLRYLKTNRIAGIFPAQFKQSSVSSLMDVSSAELANKETRDAGGESYEIIKTPDVNLGLFGSVEDIRQGHLKLISIPSRNSAPFDPVDLMVDFGASNFVALKK